MSGAERGFAAMTSPSRYDLPAPALPDRLQGLAAVAGNLAWTWNREARALFAAIDSRLWARVRENPRISLNVICAFGGATL